MRYVELYVLINMNTIHIHNTLNTFYYTLHTSHYTKKNKNNRIHTRSTKYYKLHTTQLVRSILLSVKQQSFYSTRSSVDTTLLLGTPG